MQPQPIVHLRRQRRFFGRRGSRLLTSLATLSLLTAGFYLLFNTSLPAHAWNQLESASRRADAPMAALSYESALFAPAPQPALNGAIAYQSAPLAVWLTAEPDDSADGFTPVWMPPHVPIVTPPAKPAVAVSPEQPAASAKPKPSAPATPFVPNPNAGKIREGTFIPTNPDDYSHYKDVFIKNGSGVSIDVKKLLEQPLKLKFKAKKPQILIIHTHGSESYFPDQENWYIPTDVERTENTKFNVVRIGDELAKILTAKGFIVLHDRNIYDYPTYTGAYNRSLASITRYINENPTIGMVIDLHRDSISSDSGNIYKAVTTVDKQKVAQMMLVMGSDGNGQPYPNWRDNLSLAVKLQQALNSEYPQLMRPLTLRKSRYNEHATLGSILVEVGAFGNSLPEALRAITLFGDTAAELLKPYVR